MVKYSFNHSEISNLWKYTKNKRYSIKSFINRNGYVEYIIFNDKETENRVTGVVVTKFSEGEVYHWPRLHHRSLAPLLDIIYIDERVGIYITSNLCRTLRDEIHDERFINDPHCLTMKKAYVEDILNGLDYLHSKSLSLMNVNDANVFISQDTLKAVIANFTCLVLDVPKNNGSNASKHRKCTPRMYRAPELTTNSAFERYEKFDLMATDIWAVGVMIMDIFAAHLVPWGLVDYDPNRALEVPSKIDYEAFKLANKGSSVTLQEVEEFKKFVGLFIVINPKKRCSAKKAISQKFIQSAKHHGYLKDGNYSIPSRLWTVQESRRSNRNNICIDDFKSCEPDGFKIKQNVSPQFPRVQANNHPMQDLGLFPNNILLKPPPTVHNNNNIILDDTKNIENCYGVSTINETMCYSNEYQGENNILSNQDSILQANSNDEVDNPQVTHRLRDFKKWPDFPLIQNINTPESNKKDNSVSRKAKPKNEQKSISQDDRPLHDENIEGLFTSYHKDFNELISPDYFDDDFIQQCSSESKINHTKSNKFLHITKLPPASEPSLRQMALPPKSMNPITNRYLKKYAIQSLEKNHQRNSAQRNSIINQKNSIINQRNSISNQMKPNVIDKQRLSKVANNPKLNEKDAHEEMRDRKNNPIDYGGKSRPENQVQIANLDSDGWTKLAAEKDPYNDWSTIRRIDSADSKFKDSFDFTIEHKDIMVDNFDHKISNENKYLQKNPIHYSDGEEQTLRVTRHRKGCPHQKERGRKIKIDPKQDKRQEAPTGSKRKDNLSTKQKCEASIYLLNAKSQNSENLEFDMEQHLLSREDNLKHSEEKKSDKRNKKSKEGSQKNGCGLKGLFCAKRQSKHITLS